jgi:hypothetical protein
MSRPAALIVIALVGVVVLSLPQRSAAAAEQHRPKVHRPVLLWKTFPLSQHPAEGTAPHPQTPQRGEIRSRPPLSDGPNRSWEWLWSFLVGTILALSAAAAVVMILFLTFRLRGGHMTKFRVTARDRNAKNDAEERKETRAHDEQSAGAFDVSSHISSVLSAAERAAVLIQEEVRQEAERVRQHAQKEAAASLEAAREGAEAARVQAERLRFEAEEWSKQARTAAEDHVADRRAEAEAEAREILSAAERQAISFREEAERLRQALKMDISLAEDHLRRLSTGLHDLTARVDNLLPTPLEAEAGDLAAREDDALSDALEPSRKIEESIM